MMSPISVPLFDAMQPTCAISFLPEI